MTTVRRAEVRKAKRRACALLAERAEGQQESAGGATEIAWGELAEEMRRRSGKPRTHPQDPNQTELDYEGNES